MVVVKIGGELHEFSPFPNAANLDDPGAQLAVHVDSTLIKGDSKCRVRCSLSTVDGPATRCAITDKPGANNKIPSPLLLPAHWVAISMIASGYGPSPFGGQRILHRPPCLVESAEHTIMQLSAL